MKTKLYKLIKAESVYVVCTVKVIVAFYYANWPSSVVAEAFVDGRYQTQESELESKHNQGADFGQPCVHSS